jgi:C-terminal processing protease CtpA/Prc
LSFLAEPGGWRVMGVIPDSPAAAAHVKTGTLVTAIDRIPAIQWSRDLLEEKLKSQTDLSLLLAEDTGERALTLPSWELVPLR